MSKFEDMIYELKREQRVPDRVWEKYTDTFSKLPDQPKGQGVRTKRWIRYAASAAAVVIIGSVVCYTNPALAAKIPLIGNIFREVQKSVTFSGEYDQKAEILNGQDSDAEKSAQAEYTAKSSGVTVTASEVYCDGLSVFLTAEVTMEQGGLEQIAGNVMYLNGSWKVGADGKEAKLENNYLEGKAVDDQTFVGMVKLDLEDTVLLSGIVEMELSMIGYDDEASLSGEDIAAIQKTEGTWELSLPFTVDQEAARTIAVNEENNGYHLKEVFVSPYQVVTYTDVPYTENTVTLEEFEEIMEEKTGNTDDPGITYEEYLEREGKEYAQCLTIVFNQDGEKLQPMEESRGQSVNAVQGKEISKLYIYVFDDFEAWAEMDEKGMDCAAADQAVIAAEVPA